MRLFPGALHCLGRGPLTALVAFYHYNYYYYYWFGEGEGKIQFMF